MPKIYGANPGLLAVGSPALANHLRFYEGQKLVGIVRLSAKGTLAVNVHVSDDCTSTGTKALRRK